VNACDARQVFRKSEKERHFFKQSFYQVLSEKIKKHVKRISSEKSTQSLRDADERYHVKKNEIS
jgi:hypothetical protein